MQLYEEIRKWSVALGGPTWRQRLREAIVRWVIAKLERIEREGLRGESILKCLHRDGRLDTAFGDNTEITVQRP